MISTTGRTSPSHQRVERIAITDLGFICPVGASVWETALSLRRKRSSFFADETVLVADDRYGTLLRGATVSRLPEEIMSRHLRGSDRAVALLSPAIRECTARISPASLRTPLWQIDNHLEPRGHDFPDLLRKVFPDIPIGREEEKGPQDLSRCLFFERIIRTVERLRQGKEQVALVGCVDSLIAVSRLEELLFAGRLKDAVNPEGILVGEAAGVILLEKETHARLRNAPIYASVASWGRGTETVPLSGDIPCTGRGLTDAFLDAFATLDDSGASIGAVIADLNGERSRALEWAYTEGRIFPKSGRGRVLRHPADTLGDCGGAMGAAITVDAIAGFMLHPNSPRQVALCTSDETGARRVICLEKGDHPDRMLFMHELRTKLQKQKPAALPQEKN